MIPLLVTRGQVRLFCAHGGFKGTLLVNPRLRGVIQLRRTSMKKFPPPLKPPQDKRWGLIDPLSKPLNFSIRYVSIHAQLVFSR
jgi:hypothetical protein